MIEAQATAISPDELEDLDGSDAILLVRVDDKSWAVVTPYSDQETVHILDAISNWLGRTVH